MILWTHPRVPSFLVQLSSVSQMDVTWSFFFSYVQRICSWTSQLALFPGVWYAVLGYIYVLIRIRVHAEYPQRTVLLHRFGMAFFPTALLMTELFYLIANDANLLDVNWLRPINRLAWCSHSSWQLVRQRKKRYIWPYNTFALWFTTNNIQLGWRSEQLITKTCRVHCRLDIRHMEFAHVNW